MRESKTVLITGASGGLGYEFAKLFAKDKYDLVLVARNKEKLTETAKELKNINDNIFIKIIPEDLSDPTTPQKIYDELKTDGITIEVLVNNAGFATYGNFYELDEKKEMEEIEVNVKTLTHLTRLFLPDMVERKYGKILNIASVAAFQPGPFMAVYYATKAYVLHFSEAIAEELKGTGVTVTVLCPGPTKTGFQNRAGMQKVKSFTAHTMNAQTVAKIGYEGLMKEKRIVVPGLRNTIMSQAYRIVPRSLVTRVAKNMQQGG